jgi:anti-anti-sigma factor
MEITNKGGELFFNGEFILENVEDIKNDLLKVLSEIKTQDVKLNFINILELDSAGLQTILSFCKTLKENNVGYSVSSINEDILNILEISGLGKYLNLA